MKLRDLREDNDLTQEKVANILNCKQKKNEIIKQKIYLSKLEIHKKDLEKLEEENMKYII